MQPPLGYPWQPGAGVMAAHRISEWHSQQLQVFSPWSLEPLEGRLRIFCVTLSHFSTFSDIFCEFASTLQLDFKYMEDWSLQCPASWGMGLCLSGSPLYPQDQSYHKVGTQELLVDYSYRSKCLTHSRSKTLKYLNSKIMVGKGQRNNMGLNCVSPLTLRFFFQSICWVLPAISTNLASTGPTNRRHKTVFFTRGWESADAEGWLYTLSYTILYKGLELPPTLVSTGILEPILGWYSKERLKSG